MLLKQSKGIAGQAFLMKDVYKRQIINSTYGCAGMRCMALPVIVVQESIADQFTALLKKKALDMKVGCAYDAKTDLGPVVSAEHKTKICNWIKKGVDEGAELRCV